MAEEWDGKTPIKPRWSMSLGSWKLPEEADGMTDRNTEALLWMLERSPELQKALPELLENLLNDVEPLVVFARTWHPGDEEPQVSNRHSAPETVLEIGPES